MNRKIVQFVAVLHYHGDILTLMHAPAQTNVHNDTHIYMRVKIGHWWTFRVAFQHKGNLSVLHPNTHITYALQLTWQHNAAQPCACSISSHTQLVRAAPRRENSLLALRNLQQCPRTAHNIFKTFPNALRSRSWRRQCHVAPNSPLRYRFQMIELLPGYKNNRHICIYSSS